MAALFGAPRKPGWFQANLPPAPGIVETPEQRAERERLERHFGMSGVLAKDGPAATGLLGSVTGLSQNTDGTRSIEPGPTAFRPELPDFSPEDMRTQLPDSPQRPGGKAHSKIRRHGSVEGIGRFMIDN